MIDDKLAPDDVIASALDHMQGSGEEGLSALGGLLDQYPNDPRLHFLRGSYLAGLERYSEAREGMRKAIEIVPDFAVARFQLGLMELSSGDADAARSTWYKLSDLSRNHYLRLFADGLGAMIRNELDEAVSLLEQGIAANTDNVPMNRDMSLIVREIMEKTNAPGGDAGIESDTHFLLRQFSFKDTRH